MFTLKKQALKAKTRKKKFSVPAELKTRDLQANNTQNAVLKTTTGAAQKINSKKLTIDDKLQSEFGILNSSLRDNQQIFENKCKEKSRQTFQNIMANFLCNGR